MGANIIKGTKFRGIYMGGEFTGKAVTVESDASGYPGTLHDVRVYIEIDSDLVRPSVYGDPTSKPWTSHRAGDCLVMNCTQSKGLLTRCDDKYEEVFIVRR